MASTPYALYNAFSDTMFGGSPAGILSRAAHIDSNSRIKIARELGLPATSFVGRCNTSRVETQFYSAVAELPMCGHGTVCLMTRLVDLKILTLQNAETLDIELKLPNTTAMVELYRRADDRVQVMLDVKPAQFRTDKIDRTQLSNILGISSSDICNDLPLETAVGDFIHLIVPVDNLDAMARLRPDFNAIVRFCHQHDIQTIAVFSREVEQTGSDLHVRDFCPAVGVAESAAAGTTNAALSCYLLRHGIVPGIENVTLSIVAEQGIEINRPSSIRTVATMAGKDISRLQVGGVATRVFDGQLYLPATTV